MSEINRLIAEKVMGWVETASTDPRRMYWKGSPGMLETHPASALIGKYFDPEHNISHAHIALEKFAKDNPEYYLTLKWPSPTERDFRFRIEKYSMGCNYYIQYYIQKGADTPQAAICEVIKSALEGKGMNEIRNNILIKIQDELDHAYAKHGCEQWGRHEFYAIMKEEVDEAWGAIKRNLPMATLEKEIIQIAAMCIRYLETGDRYGYRREKIYHK